MVKRQMGPGGVGGGGATGEEVTTCELFIEHNQLLWLKNKAVFRQYFLRSP